jgi:hypothetical protein
MISAGSGIHRTTSATAARPIRPTRTRARRHRPHRRSDCLPPRSVTKAPRRVLAQSIRWREPQFCDRGDQYRPAIFYHNAEQRRLAEASKAAHQPRFKQPIQTEIAAAGPFYKAEEYHQDYYVKNPIRYKFYRYNCGRDALLEELWGTKD